MARPDQVFHLRAGEKDLGFSQAVKAGGFLFVAGTCSLDLDSNVVGKGDMRAQLEQCYRLIGMALEAHGIGFGAVVKEQIFVSDIEAFRAALPSRHAVYEGAAPPAATWIEVSRFMRPDFLIEIEVTAELA